MRHTPCLLFCLLLLPLEAWGWGEPGHRIVAEVAAAQLRPAASAEVARLLAGEPEPTLGGIASWADQFRANGGDAGKRTSSWHYVNFKGGCDYVPARDCPDGNCAVGAINRFFLALSDTRRSDAERREALKFLVHFIGDIHQPLHATSREDRGGNEYQLSYRGKGTNLHAAWDFRILERNGLPASEEVRRLLQAPPLPADATRRSDRPAVEWALESCRLVETPGIYPARHILEDTYLDAQLPLAEERLRRGGARLADMLNYALDPMRAVR